MFDQTSLKDILRFLRTDKFAQFYMSNFDKFLETFLIFGGCPNPIIAYLYYILTFQCPAQKLKNFGKNAFAWNFLNILSQMFIMHIFERLPWILGFYRILKFRSDPRKSYPKTFGEHPSTEKSCTNYLKWIFLWVFPFFNRFSQKFKIWGEHWQ